MTLTLGQLAELRKRRHRQTDDTRCRSEKDALDFVDELGFCGLIDSVEADLPNLRKASVEPYEDPWGDLPARIWWDTKQTLPARKACYYAKVLRGRGTFISWECFPFFYAVYATGNDYAEDYRRGILSRDEKRILDLIAAEPEISSRELRGKFGSKGKDVTRAMDRALLPLQGTFKITVSGGSIEGWSLHNWALVEDWVPACHLDRARRITPQIAIQELVLHYIHMAIAASVGDVAWVFRKRRGEIARIIEELMGKGRVRHMEVLGLPGEVFSAAE